MSKILENEIANAIEAYYALGNKDTAEKLEKIYLDSSVDEMVYGESILDLENLECIRFGSDKYNEIIKSDE